MALKADAGPPVTLTYADLIASLPLDGSGSTAGGGVLDGYKWTIWNAAPDSTASLSADNVVAPTLQNINVPGTIYLTLNVHDSVDGWAWDPDPNSGDRENLPNIMPTAVLMISVESQNAALIKPATGERTSPTTYVPGTSGYQNAIQKFWTLFDVVEGLAGTSPSGAQQATRYVTAAAGPSTATGTISDPFNATSAAANGFDGPVNQAKNALTTGATIAALGYTIVMYPGDYDEDFNETADRTWTFNWLGNVTWQPTNDFIFSGTTGTNLVMSPLADGSSMTLGRVGLGNTVAHSWYVFWRAVAAVSVNVSGSLLAGVQASFEQCFISQAFNLPNLTINYATGTTFGTSTSDFTAGIATVMTACTFADDLSLTSASSTGGFYDCTFAGTPLFTGPAGSARFDPITARRFIAASGTFAGGAGKADFLPITTSAIVIDNGAGTGSLTTNAITTPVSTGLTVSAGSTMSVSATTTLDLGAGGAATLTAGAGADVTVTGGSSAGVVLAGGAGSTYDAKANTISRRSGTGPVVIDGQIKGYAYGITGTDTKGASTVSEVFFTNKITVDANAAAAGAQLKINFGGYTTNQNGSDTALVRVYAGALQIASIAGVGTNGADAYWGVNLDTYFVTVGASSSFRGAYVRASDDGTLARYQLDGQTGATALSGGPATTGTWDITASVQFSGSSVNNQLTILNLDAQIIVST